MLAACYGLVHDNCTKCIVNVTGVSTWGCKSTARLACYRLVQDDFTIWTIESYGIGTIIFLMVTVNIEYRGIVLIARDFVFSDFDYFCMDFISSHFC